MQVEFDRQESTVGLQFDGRDEIATFFEEAAESQAFFLELESEPQQYQTFRCVATDPGGFKFPFEAEVVQVFPRGDAVGVAFHLQNWDQLKEQLKRRLAKDEDMQESANELSPIFRMKKFNPNERFRLAMKASRVERSILLRDTTPQVLSGLLSHPQIEDREVLEIVKSPYASGGILKRVADNRKWMHNADIRLQVIKSPKTPTPLAIKHLHTLRTSELRVMAKLGNTREALRKEALKIYLARMGQT